MSWERLAVGIRALAVADSGAGGLFQVGGANLVSGFWHALAPDKAAFPYIVFTPISSVETKGFDQDATNFRVQLDVYGDALDGADPDGKVARIADRVRTVFDRVTPTLTGGWASDAMQIVSGPRMLFDDEAYRYSMDFQVIITKD